MGTVLHIDIVHVHPDREEEDPTVIGNMVIMARILLEPESSCEHEIMVAHHLMGELDKLQKSAIESAQKAFDKEPSSDNGSGETSH